MDLQKINIKLFVDAPEPVPTEPFLEIFSRWREDTSHPVSWIDLADYAHVAKGPGVMLIGHEGNLATDLADPGPGLLYVNKQGLTGTLEERLHEAFRRAQGLVESLTKDPQYPGALEPRPGFWEITINDRLEFPNTDETDQVLRPAIQAIANRVFGSDASTLVRQPDSERRYGYTLHTEHPTSLSHIAEVLEKMVS